MISSPGRCRLLLALLLPAVLPCRAENTLWFESPDSSKAVRIHLEQDSLSLGLLGFQRGGGGASDEMLLDTFYFDRMGHQPHFLWSPDSRYLAVNLVWKKFGELKVYRFDKTNAPVAVPMAEVERACPDISTRMEAVAGEKAEPGNVVIWQYDVSWSKDGRTLKVLRNGSRDSLDFELGMDVDPETGKVSHQELRIGGKKQPLLLEVGTQAGKPATEEAKGEKSRSGFLQRLFKK